MAEFDVNAYTGPLVVDVLVCRSCGRDLPEDGAAGTGHEFGCPTAAAERAGTTHPRDYREEQREEPASRR